MKYIDEFRNIKIARDLAHVISGEAKGMRNIKLMEVCGTHTMSVERFGIRGMLPENISLISGPGCPVCVTPKAYVDRAIAFTRLKNIIVASFGDMVKVPGSGTTLMDEHSYGNVRVIYSPLDAVDIARKNRDKKIVFLGIGFETTAPTVAASLEYAKKLKLRNFFVYSGHKIMPPAMTALAKDPHLNIDGFLCPAHVSAIIGTMPYETISKKYKIPCVVAGFEPIDILQGIFMLIRQVKKGKAEVENQYNRVVKKSGNKKALSLIQEVFSIVDSEWRGIGVIPKSGLNIHKRYEQLDAEKNFNMPKIAPVPDNKDCICGNVLKGIHTPLECKLFKKVCRPENPQGACMVSSEGTCAAYFKHRI